MSFKICNPKEDRYGNSKENIFLAFDVNENYLGSAFAYPTTNFYQTNETPYLIFIDINVGENADKLLENEVKKELFNRVFSRAKELRMMKPDLRCRIYSGFEHNKEKLDFYISNGLEEDYSIIMETEIPGSFSCTLPENVRAEDCKIDSDEESDKYKTMLDNIFVTPMDINELHELEKRKYFKNLYFFMDDRLQGGCIIYDKDGFGYIETLYVLPEAQGKGFSKIIVNYIFDYFKSKGLNKTRLEVWQLNTRAFRLYESFGYREVEKNLMFPGITL